MPATFAEAPDKILPARLWAPKEDGKPRCLRRPMTDEERATIEARRAEIAPWVAPFFGPDESERVAGKLASIPERIEVLPDRLLLYTDEGDATVAAVRRRGLEPLSVLVRRATLEDVFLRLTGRHLVD